MGNFNILHYATNLIYTYTIYLLMSTFQKEEFVYPKKIKILAYFLFYIIVTTVFSFINIPIVTMLANLLCLFLLCFLYNENVLNNMQIAIITYAILAIEEISVSYVFDSNIKSIFKSVHHLEISIIFLGNILLLLTAILIKYFFKTKKYMEITANTPILNVVISSVTIITTFLLALKSTIDTETFTIISITFIFINLFSMWSYEKLTNSLNEQFKIETFKEKTKSYEKELKYMNEQISLLRKYKHDEKNHFLSIRGLIQEKSDEKALEYIDSLLDFYTSEDNYIKTKNEVLNSILNYKIKKMKDNKIKINTDIRIRETIPLSDYHLSIILGNLIDNAIEAQMKIDEEKRNIDIKIIDEKNKFIIKLDNSYNGKIKQDDKDFITTKEDSQNHGIGIKNVKEILEKYNGVFKINFDEEKFSVYVMIIMNEK